MALKSEVIELMEALQLLMIEMVAKQEASTRMETQIKNTISMDQKLAHIKQVATQQPLMINTDTKQAVTRLTQVAE